MKRLIGIFISVFAVFLMSHNVSAAQRVGNYSNYVTNFSGLPTTIVNNRMYSISGSSSNLYLANGQFAYGINWVEGKTYHLSLVVSADGSGIYYVVPEAIHIDGDYYKSTNDNISSSVYCSSSTTCRYTVIHNIDIVATATGSEVVKTPTSNILNLVSNGNYSGSVQMSTMLFDDEDEWQDFKSSVSTYLNDISNNTSDTVDILDQIYDRLDVLDSNADANAEAWDNMQHTDGLIDIGDDSQALSIVGTINNVLGQVRDVSASASCTISANFGGLFGNNSNSLNLGNLNFCQGKETLGTAVVFSATVIFLFISFFICIRVIKKVLRIISWARKN